MEICWGDGECELIQPQQSWEFSDIDTRQLAFSELHTFFSTGTYQVSISECCWANDLLNMQGAENHSFILSADFKLVDPDIEPVNSMPVLPDPLVTGNAGHFISYSTNLSDEQGDLINVWFCDPGIEGYVRPDEIFQSPNSEIFLDTLDGGFIWAIPQFAGFYNLSLCQSEYRNGELISTTTRLISIVVDETLGLITERSTANLFQLYPNPARDDLCIVYDPGRSKLLNMQLINSSGMAIDTWEPDLVIEEQGNKKLSTSGIPNGFYLLVLKTNRSTEIIPLIISR